MAVEFNPEDLITPLGREDLYDGFLRYLVGIVNKFGVEIPVLLHTHGMLVSGMIIPNSKFFQVTGEKISNSTPKSEAGEAIANIFRQWQEGLEKDNADDDDEKFAENVSFIHLGGAQFFVPGQNPMPAQPIYWRGKLAEIAGFSIGQLAVGDPE